MVGTDTLTPLLPSGELTGSNGYGLTRFVPLTSTVYPLVDTQPGLQFYYTGWVGSTPGLPGVTNGPTGRFAQNLRLGSGVLVNNTQGGTIAIGTNIGNSTNNAPTVATLSEQSPPGSIFLTPQGVPKPPNSTGIARNTLIGNFIWAANAPGNFPSGPPIYNNGTCSDITAIGIGAAQSWGQNQSFDVNFIRKAINVKGGTLIGYQAGYYNCGPPTNATGNQAKDVPANIIAIGSKALFGVPNTYNPSQGFGIEYVKFPGGRNIAIGYKSNALNSGQKFWPDDALRADCDGCTTIGNNIFTTIPDDQSQDKVRNFGYVGGSKGAFIVGINAADRYWKQDNCFRFVRADKRFFSVKGELTTSIGAIYGGKRDIWETSDDMPYFSPRGIFIGKNDQEVLSRDAVGVICLGNFGMSVSDRTIAFGTNGKRLFTANGYSKLEPAGGELQGAGAVAYMSRGSSTSTAMSPLSLAVGGATGSFKIITDGVSKTYTVRSGIITQIQ